MSPVSEALRHLTDFYADLLIIIGLSALIFTVLAGVSGQECNSGKRWWKNPGLAADLFYAVINPLFASSLAMLPMLAIILILGLIFPIEKVHEYLLQGQGPFSGLSTPVQIIAFILIQDFLFYWIHRLSHTSFLWRFHRIHHSAEEVNWTTVNRIHPVSLMLENALIITILVFLGFPKKLVPMLSPIFMVWFYFVHANLNWSPGRLRLIFTTPVLHRWHHTKSDEGGNRNFGAIFSFWDILFGTYYCPSDRLPEIYGIDQENFTQNPLKQIFFSVFSR
jgi:sterol desaturase/sphingolipid hydroxylase (fatty acid hydroxylase superfamily)